MDKDEQDELNKQLNLAMVTLNEVKIELINSSVYIAFDNASSKVSSLLKELAKYKDKDKDKSKG